MASSDGDFSAGILVGLLSGIGATFIIILTLLPDAKEIKAKNICQFQGGQMHADVCIKDGVVIPVNR